MSRHTPFRVLKSTVIYRGRCIRLLKDRLRVGALPGKETVRELVEHPGAAVILPFADKDHILLLRQFRYAAKGDLWEIPAGTLEKGEAPLACARRELEEETGFKAGRWRLLTRFYPAPGISDEYMSLYEARGLVRGKTNLDHDEWLRCECVPFQKALRMVRTGRIEDAKTIVALLWVSRTR